MVGRPRSRADLAQSASAASPTRRAPARRVRASTSRNPWIRWLDPRDACCLRGPRVGSATAPEVDDAIPSV
jgi:hypothetical protein